MFVINRQETLSRLKILYNNQSKVESKCKIMEIIYQLIRSLKDKNILLEKEIFPFLVTIFQTEGDEILKNGAMSAIAELIKHIKSGITGNLPFVIRSCLNSVKISSIRLQTKQSPDLLLASSLKLIAKVLTHLPLELLQEFIQDIHDSIYILVQFYTQEDNISILINSILIKLDKLYSQLLVSEERQRLPYDFND